MKYPRFLATAFVVASVALPASAMAATPQQSLNQAIKTSMDRVPVWMSGEVTVNMSERPLVKSGAETYGTVKMGLTQRILSREKGNAQSEGRMTLDQFDFHTSSVNSETPLKIDPGLAIQWKQVGTQTYFRVERLPGQAETFFKTLGMDTSAVVGQWIQASSTSEVEGVASALSPTAALGLSATDAVSMDQLKQLKNMSIFLVRRIEKRETTSDGHVILRMRVGLNPRLVTILQTAELKAIVRTDPLRAEKIRTVNREFAKLRTMLAGTQFVAVVDQTSQTLLRMEIGGRYRAPKQSCTTNWTTGRETCRNVAMTTTIFQAGMSFASDTGSAVSAPDGAMTFMQLIERMQPPAATSTSDVLLAPDTTTTDMVTI